MTRNANHRRRIAGLALTTALASVTLAGCAGNSGPRAEVAASRAETAIDNGKAEKAVASAEHAVLAAPRNAAYRATLGSAYLSAGRFGSAATSFNDAMSLGDNSTRTALSLALAYVGSGQNQHAAAILDDWRDTIAPGDLGLAYSLAGQPERGIRILEDAIRSGQNNAKTRQNLAYSYALAGRWREARLMAQEDIPADQVSDRIAAWAETVYGGAFQARVASLLNVPATTRDPGQPTALALQNYPAAEQLASEAAALRDQELAAVAGPQPLGAASGERSFNEAFGSSNELPPLAANAAAPVQTREEIAPAVALARYDPPAPAKPQNFEAAFATKAPQGATPAAVIADTVRFASEPAVTKMPVRYGVAPAPKAVAGTQKHDGDHLVQLGSFFSEQGARRAWGIYTTRYGSLDGHEMKISRAVVNGKNYWRVSAAGYGEAGAEAMCSNVKAGGEECIPYAKGNPLPGAID
ncbi:MAG: SPOR domain-containing protein [Novosphingobium sp.]